MSSILPRCPKCRLDAPEEKKFCTGCGYNLEERREEKLRKLRIEERKEQKRRALKNAYVLMILTFLPLLPVLVAHKVEKMENLTMMICDWVVAGLIVGYMLTHGKSLKDLLVFDKSAIKWTLIAIFLCAGLLVINFAYHMSLTGLLGVEDEGTFTQMRSKGMGLVALFFYISIMPGIWEEILFRGLLLDELEVIVTPVEAAVLSSVLFSLFHLSTFSFPYLAFFGFVLVLLKRKCGSLVPGMILHALHNAVIVAYEVWF